jgi:hypothetical protein
MELSDAEFWTCEQEARFLDYLGDEHVISKIWGIPNISIITSNKFFKKIQKDDGIYFKATKHKLFNQDLCTNMIRNHWYVMKGEKWWDSYQAQLQPPNTHNFCQCWAAAYFSSKLNQISIIPGDFETNNENMARYLIERLKEINEDEIYLRCLNIVQLPDFRDSWLFG